jgi:hypothetical protein
MAYPFVQGKVKTGSAGLRWGRVRKLPPQLSKNGGKIFGFFKKSRKCSPISEVLASCFYIFALPFIKGYFSITKLFTSKVLRNAIVREVQ